MFNFLKEKLQKIYTGLSSGLHNLFLKTTIDQESLAELEKLLIQTDTGPKMAQRIINSLKKQLQAGTLVHGNDLKHALKEQLLQLLPQTALQTDHVYLLVGVNGSGKTTFAGKLAHHFIQQGKRVLLVAADTFRAAAPEQLQQWAKKTGCELIQGKQNQDPASLVFQACNAFKGGTYDVMIIDTAGRLQTKTNLMKELEKIKRVIAQQLPDQNICSLLTIDAMLGQNSFEQARFFNQAIELNGLILTKMDGTGKGGIIFALYEEFNVPVRYISYGEKVEDIKAFDARWYVEQLLQ
jgi:fused signal recognition particle receptor